MEAITTTEARKNLFNIVGRVAADHDAVEVVSKSGNVVILSKDDYDAMVETQYLMASPANAIRLLRSLEAVQCGEYSERDLSEFDLDL